MMVTSLLLGLLLAPPLSGAALEREARHIETLLIAPCCWMQQVSEHRSEAADDIRRDVRALLAAGRSRQEILDAYVARYGKRILAEPPLGGLSWLLYVGPWLVGLVTAGGLVVLVRRMTRTARAGRSREPAAMTLADQTAYEALLDDELRALD